tara:strand:+ start:1788 stop:2333 length:546 start_codon:yes stop_codon:yes gene_type:complete
MQFIHLIEGAYSKQSCDNLIDFFEKNINLAESGGAGNKKLNNLEISLDLDFNNPSSFGLELMLSNMISQYKEKFPFIDSNIVKWHVTPTCQLAKYEPNNYYSYVHCENSGLPKHLSRVFAWMLYLNDIREGGGTYFHHQNFTTKPVAGNLYIWPAGWTHMHVGVNAPYESKYTITGWVKYI